MSIVWQAIAVGVLATGVGVGMVFRSAIVASKYARRFARGRTRFAPVASRRSTPTMIKIVGVFFLAMGALMVLLGLFYRSR